MIIPISTSLLASSLFLVRKLDMKDLVKTCIWAETPNNISKWDQTDSKRVLRIDLWNHKQIWVRDEKLGKD